MANGRTVLWDLPTRIFHWALVTSVVLAWWSAEEENYDLHEWMGYTIIVLVASRICWGFVGSLHSRFSDFVAGPGRIGGYLRGELTDVPGHNPLGGWSVMLFLCLLLLQAVSGLFNSDDVLFSGPLYYAADSDFRDFMGTVHDVAFDLLTALICLHVAAVVYYQRWRRQKLLQAMVVGSAEGREGRAPPVHWWRALVVVTVVALLLWWGLEQAPQPQPMW